MRSIEKLILLPESTIGEAFSVLDGGGEQIAFLCDADGVLLGTITDGDLRRALLSGKNLEDLVEPYANSDFKAAEVGESRESLISLMKANLIHQIPLLDEGRLVGLRTLDALFLERKQDAQVVIMAGGRGLRLRPLTESIPKPMLHVGGKPILETIVGSLREQGFEDILISVNYLKEAIQEHFGDGGQFGVNIAYLEEQSAMGTAGSLALLNDTGKDNVIVLNGDVLTRIDFANLLSEHKLSKAHCTVCVQEYTVDIPYGVVQIEDGMVTGVSEKPSFSYPVNAGVYAFTREALAGLEKDEAIDMPSFVEVLVDQGRRVLSHRVTDYWLDIGQHAQLTKAMEEYEDHFK